MKAGSVPLRRRRRKPHMIDYIVTRLVVGGLDTNCYILKHRQSRAAAVIDPGGDLLVIKNALFEQEASLRLILLTHGHIDHILALEDLRTPNTIVCIHKNDAHMLVERDLFTSMVPHDPASDAAGGVPVRA